jgi:hypothetical protein
MKRYMVVLKQGEDRSKKVILIIEAGQNDNQNIHMFAQEFSKEWCINSKKYPSPQFDIVIGAWDNLKNAEQSMRDSYGWESARFEKLIAQV